MEQSLNIGDKVKVKGTNNILTIRDVFYNCRNNFDYAQFIETPNMLKFSDLEKIQLKFKIGDIVRVQQYKTFFKIVNIIFYTNEEYKYEVKDQHGNIHWFNENELIPLKFHINDKCIYKYQETTVIDIDIQNSYPYLILSKNGGSHWVSDIELKPIINDFKQTNMKELNLYHLLKKCVGEEIYSPTFGTVKINMVNVNCISVLPWNNNPKSFCINGCYVNKADAVVSLFPSKELYEKYPLDAYSAWMEWKEKRTPKFRLYLGYNINHIIDDENDKPITDRINHTLNFNTKEEAEEAVKNIEQYLQTFNNELKQ